MEKTKNNIERIENFTKYLKHNFDVHSKQAKQSDSIDDMNNSVAFLKDYAEVSEKLITVINEYNEKTGSEF